MILKLLIIESWFSNKLDWKFKSAASYAYGVLDYKWIVGAPATSV